MGYYPGFNGWCRGCYESLAQRDVKTRYNLPKTKSCPPGSICFWEGIFLKDIAGKHLAGQLIRAANGAALNYGEAKGAQTDKDFAYKTSLVLKELNEAHVSLKILLRIGQGDGQICLALKKECMELIAIATTMIKNKKIIK